MENKAEFVSYKKVIIFGCQGSGKSSLTSRLEKGSFSTENPTEDGNIFFF